jgi:phosphatidylglycerol---prolipoprotein diacylglyceryl transferase
MRPTLFNIGSFAMPSYGAMLVIAFMLGIWIAAKRASRFGLTREQVIDVSFWTVLVGILGARVLYMVQHSNDFRTLAQIFTPKFQGLTSFGGLIGGALGAWLSCRKSKVSFRGYLDAIAPGLLVGQAIGRVGCLLHGCCYGPVCSPDALFAVKMVEMGSFHFPAQLVDSVGDLIGAGCLLWAERSMRRPVQPFGFALMAFGMSRFVFELWRMGVSSDPIKGLGITDAQVISIIMAVGGFLLAWYGVPERKGREVAR